MTTYKDLRPKFRSAILAVLIALILAGCGSTPTISEKEEEQVVAIRLEDIPKLLRSAETAEGQEKFSLLLQACNALYIHRQYDWARNIVSQIRPNALTDDNFISHSVISAKLAMVEGKQLVAYRYLWDQRFVDILPTVERSKHQAARELRASLLFDLSEYKEAINERLVLHALLYDDQDQSEFNQDLTWQTLMELPLDELKNEAENQVNLLHRGWYTLAVLSKDNQTNLRRQLSQVESWASNWPEHPASKRLPADLQLLKQLVDRQAQQIALLLPLSGKLAKASQSIRDGVMAAYYQSAIENNFVPDIRVYDTSAGDDINAIYDQALLDGAEIVIGPLDKEKIDELAQRPQLTVPTLALNYIEQDQEQTYGLYQFGLAVEDEAEQVAERAWRDGHRRVLILAPASTFGDRSVKSFSDVWLAQGGEIIRDHRFKNQKEYSRLIRDALHVSDSQKRKNRLQRIIGESIEFEPRRRKDVDMIFLVAHPSQARQIKPTLAFHYAGQIPVYATSHIYNGEKDQKANRDMNAIRFTTLPWFFATQMPEKQNIDSFTSNAASYQKLYALGVDAYHLYPRLKQLEQVKQAHFYGSTGALSMDQNRRIIRQQTWAQFINGQALLMPKPIQDNEES